MPDENRINYFHIDPGEFLGAPICEPYFMFINPAPGGKRLAFQFLKEELVFMQLKLLFFCTSQNNILWQEPGKILHLHLRVLYIHVENYVYIALARVAQLVGASSCGPNHC